MSCITKKQKMILISIVKLGDTLLVCDAGGGTTVRLLVFLGAGNLTTDCTYLGCFNSESYGFSGENTTVSSAVCH